MGYIKTFENFKEKNTISIVFSQETLKDAYWKVYYPASKGDIEADVIEHDDVMEYDDYIESVLDIISGEAKAYLRDELSIDTDAVYVGSLRNKAINLDEGSITFSTKEDLNIGQVTKLNDYIKSIIPMNFDNSIYNTPLIEWEIKYNNTVAYKDSIQNIDYSRMSSEELQKEVDNALDRRDFDTLKRIKPYLESVKVLERIESILLNSK